MNVFRLIFIHVYKAVKKTLGGKPLKGDGEEVK